MSDTTTPSPDENLDEALSQDSSAPTVHDPSPDDSVSRGKSALWIVAGVAVFVVCCIIQGACGSSMFSGSYYSNGWVSDILINLTFWPGWIASIGLVLMGLAGVFLGGSKKS